MVPADSIQVSRDWTYSGNLLLSLIRFHVRDCHPLWSTIPDRSTTFSEERIKLLQPLKGNPWGLGYSAFARRYWRNRFFFLFLWLLRCFSSPGWIGNHGINARLSATPSISQTSTPILSTPRHPPCALSSLTTYIQHSKTRKRLERLSRINKHKINAQDHMVTMLEFIWLQN